MRILLTLHHRLSADAGAPGATLALGRELTEAGHRVRFLSLDRFFPRARVERARHQVVFPWLTAMYLSVNAGSFDVIDASTGDIWLWGLLASLVRSPAVVTRSHGLEHVADESARDLAARVGPPLSWKYPLYHGGLRLWEVRRSLAAAERSILLNSGDRDYACDRLGIPAERLTVLPNGIASHFHDLPAPAPADGTLQVAFIGRWTSRKGSHTLTAAAARLDALGVDFAITLLGTHDESAADRFPPSVRERVTVVPTFRNADLPALLRDRHVLVLPSTSEGWSGSLAEAMASGLAPVATRVGAAADVIDDKRSGFLVPVEDAHGIASAIAALDADRVRLDAVRAAAQARARDFRWSAIAGRTLDVYRDAMAARAVARDGGRLAGKVRERADSAAR